MKRICFPFISVSFLFAERGAVFRFVLVFKHTEVAVVAALCDIMVFERFENSTTRFVGVGAVTEAAVLREMKDFLEVAADLLRLHVEGAEALDAGSVDEPRA